MVSEKKTYSNKFDKDISLIEIGNENLKAEILDYGAIIRSLSVRKKDGFWLNTVLGFEDISDYAENPAYFGAVCGRHTGRILDGEFSIDNKKYILHQNYPPYHVHGGKLGLDKRFWKYSLIADGVVLYYHSPDGEEGYPGDVDIYVTYRILGNEFHTEIFAQASRTTPLNIVNHTYFNISSEPSIHQHELKLNSKRYGYFDKDKKTLCKNTEKNTMFSFYKGKMLASILGADDPEISYLGGGLDNFYIIDAGCFWSLELLSKIDNLLLRVHTNRPCYVLFTGNSLGNNLPAVYQRPAVAQFGGISIQSCDVPNGFQEKFWGSGLYGNNKHFVSNTIWKFCNCWKE